MRTWKKLAGLTAVALVVAGALAAPSVEAFGVVSGKQAEAVPQTPVNPRLWLTHNLPQSAADQCRAKCSAHSKDPTQYDPSIAHHAVYACGMGCAFMWNAQFE